MQKKTLRQGGVGLMALGVLGAAATGCLTREVATGTPVTKLSVTAAQDNRKVNKIDLLFAIDDSSSMGDKQKFLAEAVPTLLTRLVSPNCVVEPGGADAGKVVPRVGKECPAGSKSEFDSITDIHVGVVSSSIGTSGANAADNICAPNLPLLNRRSELWAPTTPAANAPKTEPSKFLGWFPTVDPPRDFPTTAPTQPYTDPALLIAAFTKFFGNPSEVSPAETAAIGQSGCGIEAQLESVYQFLIAPDPYKEFVARGSDFNASTNPVRTDVRDSLLKQRKDFLRPDSLVAVIMLTDENDASIDPEVFGGSGGRFGSFAFGSINGGIAASTKPKPAPYSGVQSTKGFSFPKPTSACADLKNANSDFKAKCSSCAVPSVTAATNPECTDPHLAPEDDALNARYARMKQRYGLDPLFPISRYVRGFSSSKVPRRSEEHNAGGTYLTEAGTCTNPLFAAELPGSSGEELCDLKPGTRTAELVYFAIIGGVPQDLLRDNGVVKPFLSDNDWVHILGKNPDAFDFDGIDPRMYEMGRPRTAANLEADKVTASPAGIDEVRAAVNAGKTAASPDFVINDRNTNVAGKEASFGADLNYACTFTLETPRDVSATDIAGPGDCNKHYDSEACNPVAKSEATTRKQIRAKAYPTTRELQLARALGSRGIAASLCPLRIAPAAGLTKDSDPDYGYNPAVKSIVDRLADAINARCLSQPLKPTSEAGQPVVVDCAMYEIVADGTPAQDGECAGRPNRLVGDSGILARFRESLRAEGSVEQAGKQICVLKQLPVLAGDTCLGSGQQGWCYVQASGGKTPAGKCGQAVVFQKDTLVNGSQVRIQCVTE